MEGGDPYHPPDLKSQIATRNRPPPPASYRRTMDTNALSAEDKDHLRALQGLSNTNMAVSNSTVGPKGGAGGGPARPAAPSPAQPGSAPGSARGARPLPPTSGGGNNNSGPLSPQSPAQSPSSLSGSGGPVGSAGSSPGPVRPQMSAGSPGQGSLTNLSRGRRESSDHGSGSNSDAGSDSDTADASVKPSNISSTLLQQIQAVAMQSHKSASLQELDAAKLGAPPPAPVQEVAKPGKEEKGGKGDGKEKKGFSLFSKKKRGGTNDAPPTVTSPSVSAPNSSSMTIPVAVSSPTVTPVVTSVSLTQNSAPDGLTNSGEEDVNSGRRTGGRKFSSAFGSIRKTTRKDGELPELQSMPSLEETNNLGAPSSPHSTSSGITESGEISPGVAPVETPVFAVPAMVKLSPRSRCEKIAREILDTEQTYVRALQALLREYREPLLAWAGTDAARAGDVNKIFSTLPIIVTFNAELLRQLEERIRVWSEWTLLGDIFIKLAPFLKMYNEYGNNYDVALELYHSRMTKDPSFAAVVEAADRRVTLRLEGCLIMPIQRVPRYKLLLADLLQNTAEGHADSAPLSEALGKIEAVANFLDNSMKDSQQTRKLAELSTKAGGMALLAPHRRLILEGVLALESVDKSVHPLVRKKGGAGRAKAVNVYLFNDILVHVRMLKMGAPKNSNADLAKVENQWPLALVWASEGGDPKTWILTGPGRKYTISCKTASERTQWLTETRRAVESVSGSSGEARSGKFVFPGKGLAYAGDWVSGRAHGQGVLTLHGSTYTGAFVENVRAGQGAMQYINGDVFVGQWREDAPVEGELRYSCGHVYSGPLRDGRRHGRGAMRYAHGDTYEGDWVDGLPQGQGTFASVQGHSYRGGWHEGVFHGEGTFESPKGASIYVGFWSSGRRQGRGHWKKFAEDGRVVEEYDGEWADDRRVGQGVARSARGTYAGEFDANEFSGQGTMTYVDGSSYTGMWKAGLFHGEGRYAAPVGVGVIRSYEGEYLTGLRHGRGILVFHSGSRHEGMFRKDMPHGPGISTTAGSELKVEGKWVNGFRVGAMKLAYSAAQDRDEIVLNTTLNDAYYDVKDFRVYLPSSEYSIDISKFDVVE